MRYILMRRQGATESFPAGVTLRDIDGGPTYFADNGFTYAANAGWDDPSFYPIGVWLAPLSSQAHADQWLDLGINFIHGITHPAPATTLSLLTSNGLYAVLQDEWFADGISSHANVVGLIAWDEPGSLAEAWGNIESCPNAVQNNRFWYETYTHNQLVFGDVGGVPMETLVSSLRTTPNSTTRHIDVVAIDLYWFHGAGIPAWQGRGADTYGIASMTEDQMRMGRHYGYLIEQERIWQEPNYPAPIWNFIENGGPWTETSPYITPPEMNAAVWGHIIAGGRAFTYFNHTFGPPENDQTDNFGAAYFQTIQPGQSISIYDQAKATNSLVQTMASVINSSFADGYVSVSPAPTGDTDFTGPQFIVMAKYQDRGAAPFGGPAGKFYIFAMPMYGPATGTNHTATFTIKNTGATQVTVLNESRTISVTNGGTQFVDTFANSNTVHIYRVD